MIDLGGASVLITGAASGIGRSLAIALAKRGAFTVLADRDEAGLRAAAAAIGPAASYIVTDLADPAAPKALVAQAFAQHGRLDLLCSNAGIGRNKRLIKEPLDASATNLFDINFWAALRLAQAYLPLLEAHAAHGRLMITASENSLSVPAAVRGAGLGLYAASKAALLIMAEWLRDELAGKPLAVHVLLPGGVYTPLIAKALPDPAQIPPEMHIITADRCAELALQGLDQGLFYIPTHAHLAEDQKPRAAAIAESLSALGLLAPS